MFDVNQLAMSGIVGIGLVSSHLVQDDYGRNPLDFALACLIAAGCSHPYRRQVLHAESCGP